MNLLEEFLTIKIHAHLYFDDAQGCTVVTFATILAVEIKLSG